jgi:hypothetical protein
MLILMAYFKITVSSVEMLISLTLINHLLRLVNSATSLLGLPLKKTNEHDGKIDLIILFVLISFIVSPRAGSDYL